MRLIKPFCASLMLLAGLYASPSLLAGPLDRMDTGPRMNPATNDMLRVPGVVGMDYQSALATLQQAGLNPRVHMLHKQNRQYAGQEGAVVWQLPAAGGMAMLGSSVSISVYAPDNGSGPGNGMPDQAPSYDQGNGGTDTGGAGPAPGQQEPATGDNGQVGADNGGFAPPAGSGGRQGPSSGSAPVQQPEAPSASPISPPMPEKNQSPVVEVPVRLPGTYPVKPGHDSAAGAPPSEHGREQAPAGKPVLPPIPVKAQTMPEKKPVLHPVIVKVPTMPKKKAAPVVKVPVKPPGLYPSKGGQEPGAGSALSEPGRKRVSVAHAPTKKPSKKKGSATGGGEAFKPIDWGLKVTGGDQQPSVPKKPEGHSALLGSHQGVFGR